MLSSRRLRWLGKFDDAVSNGLECLRQKPNDSVAQTDLGVAYLALNRLDDVQRIAEKLGTLSPDIPHAFIYRLGFLRHDNSEMERQLMLATGKRIRA
jgi:hypothetical protein